MIVEVAPAKINLALHVVGQRADGYHLIQSLVTFAGASDRLTFSSAGVDSFTISGRYGEDLRGDGLSGWNLVILARDLIRRDCFRRGTFAPPPVAIHLEKNLPIASGIGGGSADAAATLRALNRLWRLNLNGSALAGLGLEIGADVPMCLQSQPLLAEGIGEMITPRPDMPAFPILIANPMVGVSTPVIFRTLKNKANPRFRIPPAPSSAPVWSALLSDVRNDLQQPAESLEPVISEVLHLLGSRDGAWLSRMSGSGATCFALFSTLDQALAARDHLARIRPDWYVHASMTVGTAERA